MFTEKRYEKENKRQEKLYFSLCAKIFLLFFFVFFPVQQKLSAQSAGNREVYPAPVKKLSDAQKHALSLRAKFRPGLKKQLEAQTRFHQDPSNLQPVRTMNPVQTYPNYRTAPVQQSYPRQRTAVKHIPASSRTPAIRVLPMPANARPVIPLSSPVRTSPVHTAPMSTSPVRTSPAAPVRNIPGQQLRTAASGGTSAVRQTAAPQMKIRLVKIGKEKYCFLNDIALYYKMRIRYYRNGVELFSPGKSIRFYNEKRTGSINNVPVSFLYAPVVRAKTQYFIHSKDALILLASTMSSIAVSSPVKTIMLDPGHGGTDHGALGTNIHEKQMNLNTALLVRAGLTRLGYKVIMTRSKDVTLTLDARTAHCKKMKPDLFVSIHCNAAVNKNVSGIETFAATPFGAPSTGKKTAANIKTADPGNAFDRNNYRLAYEIQKSLITQTSAVDRGVKVARYKVIRDASCPAALVEIGFITNTAEQKKFINTAHRNKIVNGIVLGIHNYAKSLTIVDPVKNSPAAAVRR